jgi:hypothetical protein
MQYFSSLTWLAGQFRWEAQNSKMLMKFGKNRVLLRFHVGNLCSVVNWITDHSCSIFSSLFVLEVDVFELLRRRKSFTERSHSNVHDCGSYNQRLTNHLSHAPNLWALVILQKGLPFLPLTWLG